MVDARDRLRRYLEQRRELGESEFVLDGLPVDDVLKLVGVRTGSRRRPTGSAAAPVLPQGSRASDGPPPGLMDGPPPEDDAALDDVGPPSHPASVPPPAPERRFAPNASTDWRETLR
ncbi:MAG: hypothetical protein ACK5AK_01150, partial [Gemmatimonas sp.]